MNEYKPTAILKQPHLCLWVGAGVSIQLASAVGAETPNWEKLVSDLEAQAKTQPPTEIALANRLDVVLAKLGRVSFQRQLRERLLTPIATGILAKWRNGDLPAQAKALSHLAFLANPIVNFNVEMLSSLALVCGTSTWSHHAFRPPVPDSPKSLGRWTGGQHAERSQRRIYHPHGALEESGICVMTATEYRSMNGTLGLQLATHAAFGLTLVIVGMSMEDSYLRAQVETFRDQIRGVVWITDGSLDGLPDEIASWCYRSRVRIQTVEWREFWERVLTDLPGPQLDKWGYEWLFDVARRASWALSNPTTTSANSFIHTFGLDSSALAAKFRAAEMAGEELKLDPKRMEVLTTEARAILKTAFTYLAKVENGPASLETAAVRRLVAKQLAALETTLGRVPGWVSDRLATASRRQLHEVGLALLDAKSYEAFRAMLEPLDGAKLEVG